MLLETKGRTRTENRKQKKVKRKKENERTTQKLGGKKEATRRLPGPAQYAPSRERQASTRRTKRRLAFLLSFPSSVVNIGKQRGHASPGIHVLENSSGSAQYAITILAHIRPIFIFLADGK